MSSIKKAYIQQLARCIIKCLEDCCIAVMGFFVML